MERGTNKNVSPKFWCGFLVSTSSERRTVSDAENDVYPESSTIQSVEDALASDLARFWSLDTLIQWLTVIRDGSDIHPIPVLKGCVAVMLDIAQNVKLARAYRGDCWSLMHKLDKLMRLTVLAPQNLPVLSKSPAQTILEETHMALKEIELFVAGLAKRRSSFKRFVLASADKAEITKYESKIEEIRKDFHTRALVLLVQNSGADHNQYRKLHQEDVMLHQEWRSTFQAWRIYEGMYRPTRTPALVLKYHGGPSPAEEQEFLRVMRGFRQRWEPNLPQFLGASESRPTGDDRFIVLEGPQGDGKVAKYISSLAARSPLEASRTLICMLKGLGSGAKHSLERTKGQWGLTDYDVYIGEHEQLVVYNFGLMLDPQWDGPRLRLQDWRHWDAFINLFTKTLTNDSKQANYIHGQIGASKQAVFRLVKHLVIFAWDYSNTIGDQIRKTSTAAVTMMLVAFMESLSRMEACLDEIDNEDRNPLLTVLVKIFGQKLSGIWDFDSPQNIATGDIGYMAGTITKPRFERLGNILNEIPSVTTVERLFLPIQYRPQDDFWSEDVVDGVVRHKCLVANMSAKETLFRVERGHRSGRLDESLMGGYMRWDCSRTWEYLLNNREDLCRRYADNHSLSDDDLLLIFSHKQSTGHGMILFVSNSLTSDERRAVLQSEGFDGDVLYFFENVNPRHGELWGYWSREAEPGHPIWPPSIDAEGPPWAWDARKDNYRVEVSRTGPQQHIRYLQL